MVMFVIRRIGQIAVSLVVILVITFYLMHAAPGDFFNIERLMNQQVTGSRLSQFEEKSQTLMLWEERYGENTPVWKQILIYLRHAAVLDFGPSFRYPDTTIQEMMTRAFPRTFVLAFSPMLLALLIGIPMGIGAALYRNTWADRAHDVYFHAGHLHSFLRHRPAGHCLFRGDASDVSDVGMGDVEVRRAPGDGDGLSACCRHRPVRTGEFDQGTG